MQEGTEQALLRIHEAAEEVGLTPRSVRYYEEQGLLKPAARSEGDYRLYDQTDLGRLRFIKGLRDDAGFSLAEIRQLLEDEDARERGRAVLATTHDPIERRGVLEDRLHRIDRQIDTLRSKIGRLQAMVDDAVERRGRLQAKIDDVESDIAARPEPKAQTRVGAAA